MVYAAAGTYYDLFSAIKKQILKMHCSDDDIIYDDSSAALSLLSAAVTPVRVRCVILKGKPTILFMFFFFFK
jgi:hypothetical protein